MVNLTDEDMAEIYQLLKSGQREIRTEFNELLKINLKPIYERLNDLEKRVIYLETKERVN